MAALHRAMTETDLPGCKKRQSEDDQPPGGDGGDLFETIGDGVVIRIDPIVRSGAEVVRVA